MKISMNIKANISRYLKFLDVSEFFTFYIFLFCVLILGIFGVIRLGSLAYKKIILLNEMNKTIISLNEKEKSLSNLSKNYDQDIKPLIPYLDAYMPTDINLDDYIVSLNSVVGIKGFFLKNVSPTEAGKDKSQEIVVSMEGYGEMKDLLKGVEELKRITQVTSIQITEIKGRLILAMNLKIYTR